jgi:hypothetical protein
MLHVSVTWALFFIRFFQTSVLRFSSYAPPKLMDNRDVAQFGFVQYNVILIE